MPLTLAGATSGSTTLQATDAVTATITLPSTSGTVVVNNGAQTIEFADGSASTPSITNSGDTNTGMFFPAADTIAFTEGGTESMRLDSSGNLGLGVTPSAWNSAWKGIQLSPTAALTNRTNKNLYLSNNWYIDSGSTDRYIQNGYATFYSQDSGGQHTWYTAASGTAGNAITFTQAMTLDASGQLAIGRATAATMLDIEKGGATTNATSGIVTLRTSTSGTAAAGLGSYINFLTENSNGTQYETAYIGSATESSTAADKDGYIFFSTALNSTNPTERMRIDSSGNLLVGTTSSGYVCRVQAVTTGNADVYLAKVDNIAAAPYVAWSATTSGNPYFALFLTDATVTRGSITYNRAGGLTVYNTTSDYRAKTVNGVVENALGKLALLKPSTGRMNGASEDIDFFVAHELQEVVPSAVTGEKDAVKEDGTPDYQMVDKSALIPLLTAAIQELKVIVDTQAEQIKALQGAA
jgi:predicted RecA/RadA family phage recombinase